MRESLKSFFTRLLLAFGFLTIVPGLGRVHEGADDLGKSSSFFSVVGLVIGMGVYLISLIPVLSPFSRAVLCVVFLFGFTRGLHADGVIDTFDGFLSGRRRREETLAVMKDARVGALGWMGAFSVYILKIALIYEILIHLPESRRTLLILPAVLSRGGVAFYAFLFPPARREESLGKSFLEGVRLRELLASVLLMELLSFRPNIPPALMLPAAVLCFWLLWGFLCRIKIGGITGDTIGAGIEFSEVVGFALVLILIV
jgi:cobalamin 5'-phosphate synthase/cobalamin synthase